MAARREQRGEVAGALAWHRSTFCAQGECVEIAVHEGSVFVRDSKAPDVPPLAYSYDEFSAFVRGIQKGDFNSLLGL